MKRIEMKFLVDAELSLGVQAWARDHLGIDQASNSDGGDSYDINTLYLDTPELDLLHDTGRVGRTKHRVRRYGNESMLWLETKRKKKMVVRKNRSMLHESDFAADRPIRLDDPRCDDWFIERIERRNLHPAVCIGYRRFARTTTWNGQSLRLTIDSAMHARAADRWKVPTTMTMAMTPTMVPTGDPLGAHCATRFGTHEVLELKFTGAMPALFKQLLRTFTLRVTGFSKYRSAMSALQGDNVNASCGHG